MIYWNDPKQTDFNLICLNNSGNTYISHDNIFDTLLSIMSVSASAYEMLTDPFIQCKSQSAIVRTTVSTSIEMEIVN